MTRGLCAGNDKNASDQRQSEEDAIHEDADEEAFGSNPFLQVGSIL